MVFRCDLPISIKRRFSNVEGLKLLDRILPWWELELEFVAADILILPAHIPLLWVFLDAMSYELPVVTTDAWGNDEIVEDGVSGLIVHDESVAANYDKMLPRCFVPPRGSPEYNYIIQSTSHCMVRELVEKLSMLIEHTQLRRKLGRAGRDAVEFGRFSMDRRNAGLKQILDSAMEPRVV
jgi:glycosyltransferase involved in cell wall biosynthesis